MFDKEILPLQSYLKTQGITIHTATKVLGLEEKGGSHRPAARQDERRRPDFVRRPRSECFGLNLEGRRKYDRRGIGSTSFQTNEKHLAIGDDGK